MGMTSFHDLSWQVYQLYDAAAYTQALNLVEQERTKFPENGGQIAYWLLCLYAVVGNRAQALRVFHETLDQGGWFAPVLLEQDTDFVALRPLPDFQAMMEVCRQRLARVKDHARPSLLVKQPQQGALALPLLIVLHGNEGNGRDTLEEWSEITDQGWLLGVPTSSQIVGPNEFVWDEREAGINEVRAHLATLSSDCAVDPERVVLGGFSMGGGLAIWMALKQSIKTRGFIALGAYLSPEELEALPGLLEQLQSRSVRGSLLVGAKDTEHLNIARTIVEVMHAHDLPCELEILPGFTHVYPPDFSERAVRALAFIERA